MLHGVDSDPISFLFDKSSDGAQRLRRVAHRNILAELAALEPFLYSNGTWIKLAKDLERSDTHPTMEESCQNEPLVENF